MHSAIRRARSRDFWQLRRYLPRETRAYVPLFYAILKIVKNPQEYGFANIPYLEPVNYDITSLPRATDLDILAKCAGTTVQTLRHLNPSLLRYATPPEKNFKLRIPKGSLTTFTAAYGQLKTFQKQPLYTYHKVRRGENIYRIAKRYGITERQLLTVNKIRNRNRIYVGQRLKIPASRTVAYKQPAPKRRKPSNLRKVIYVVKRGDTLSEIAEYKFLTRASSLRRWNGLRFHDKIYPGQRLVVWVKRG